jgi:hypothetical protein
MLSLLECAPVVSARECIVRAPLRRCARRGSHACAHPWPRSVVATRHARHARATMPSPSAASDASMSSVSSSSAIRVSAPVRRTAASLVRVVVHPHDVSMRESGRAQRQEVGGEYAHLVAACAHGEGALHASSAAPSGGDELLEREVGEHDPERVAVDAHVGVHVSVRRCYAVIRVAVRSARGVPAPPQARSARREERARRAQPPHQCHHSRWTGKREMHQSVTVIGAARFDAFERHSRSPSSRARAKYTANDIAASTVRG